MRRSFDGLGRMVDEIIREDPLGGHLFVFINRRCDRTKVLYWDRDGYAIWYKRLEEGTFRIPPAEADRLEVTPSELSLLLGGVDLVFTRRRKRYQKTF
jgi:transposase